MSTANRTDVAIVGGGMVGTATALACLARGLTVTLVDPGGNEFARGTARSELLQPGTTGQVDVLVPTTGAVDGSCELREVTSAS